MDERCFCGQSAGAAEAGVDPADFASGATRRSRPRGAPDVAS
jgi:hypothetical protein